MSSVNEQILDAFRAHIQDINQRFVNHRKTAPQILKVRTIDTKAKAKAKGQDLIHNECGAWTLVRVGQQLQLQSGEDFRSSLGPDRHVYMSNGLAMKDNDELSSRPIN